MHSNNPTAPCRTHNGQECAHAGRTTRKGPTILAGPFYTALESYCFSQSLPQSVPIPCCHSLPDLFKKGGRQASRRFRHALPSPSEENQGAVNPMVKTKAACRASVGHRGKHFLQAMHSLAAISGIKLISLWVPRSTKPMAFFFATSAQ